MNHEKVMIRIVGFIQKKDGTGLSIYWGKPVFLRTLPKNRMRVICYGCVVHLREARSK